MAVKTTGHLLGDTVIKADYFCLVNNEGTDIIKYTRAGGLEIGGIASPTGDSDAATKKYVDDSISAAIVQAIGGSY